MWDAIVIGAGHNGLTTAGLLAKRGRKVLVLERRDVVGGLAASEEFHPGYRSAGLLHDTSGVRSDVIRELALERHGLRLRDERPTLLALGSAGDGLLLPGDVRRAAGEIERRSARDAQRWAQYHARLEKLRSVLQPFLLEPPVDLLDADSLGGLDLLKRGLRVRRLGKQEMLELLRLPPMCVGDWLDEWFETDLLKAALALPAIAGTFTGPRSPGSNTNLLLHACAAGPGIVGGGPALAGALERSVRELGVEIRTGAVVGGILISRSVEGVRLEDGEELHARLVAASCHPKHVFLSLLPPGSIPYRFERRVDKLRSRGTTAQVLFALAGPLRFACRPGETIDSARTGSTLNDLERAFDAIKYRTLAARPILDIHVPTVASPELAPAGRAVASVLVHFAPYDLEPGWDDEQRQRLGNRVQALLEEQAPDADIVARQVLCPADLESRYAIPGGNIHHGEHSLDQLLVRPAPGCSGYATPVPGLFLCGSGSHPGGGLTCGPGALAARAILEPEHGR